MSLKLYNSDLKGLDLTGINFENALLFSLDLQGADLTNVNLKNANLIGTELQKVRLSENVVIPNYDLEIPTDIFEAWDTGSEEQKNSYQKLVNARVDIFEKISNDRLLQVNWQKKDLRNAYFFNCKFQNIDFSDVNLENALFLNCDVTGTNFTNANLKQSTYLKSTSK